jgi:hypothetical protein
MTYEIRPESGSLFKNERKRPDKQDPDYTGTAMIGGAEHFVDAWINESKQTGRKYLGLKFKPKQSKAAAPSSAPAQVEEDLNDDIPF